MSKNQPASNTKLKQWVEVELVSCMKWNTSKRHKAESGKGARHQLMLHAKAIMCAIFIHPNCDILHRSAIKISLVCFYFLLKKEGGRGGERQNQHLVSDEGSNHCIFNQLSHRSERRVFWLLTPSPPWRLYQGDPVEPPPPPHLRPPQNARWSIQWTKLASPKVDGRRWKVSLSRPNRTQVNCLWRRQTVIISLHRLSHRCRQKAGRWFSLRSIHTWAVANNNKRSLFFYRQIS